MNVLAAKRLFVVENQTIHFRTRGERRTDLALRFRATFVLRLRGVSPAPNCVGSIGEHIDFYVGLSIFAIFMIIKASAQFGWACAELAREADAHGSDWNGKLVRGEAARV